MSTKILFISFLLLFFNTYCKQSNKELIDKGITLQDQGKYEQAIEVYSKIINRNAKLQLPYYNRGLCYLQMDNYAKAIIDFNKIISLQTRDGGIIVLNPNSPVADENAKMYVPYDDVLYQRAQTRYFMDSLLNAYSDFQRLIDKDYKEKVFCIIFQGDIWHLANRDDSACKYLNLARTLATSPEEIEESDKLIKVYCENNSR